MLAALDVFGPDGADCRLQGRACFGRALRRALPEDDFDRQPLIGGGGRYLLSADVRIDNRSELAGELGIPPAESRQMSDSDLLLRAWERWQLACFDHLLGDVAVAVWDSAEQRLTLARSAASLKPLFYHRGTGFIALASMPQAIHALGVFKGLDEGEAGAIVAGLPYLGFATAYEDVRLVRHGHAVELAQGGAETTIRHWHPEGIVGGSFQGDDYGEALRAELDRAVAAQLRRRSGRVAAQLSAGRDSSAVATSAALALSGTGDELIALTGAPREGFAGRLSGNRVADESGLAAMTAGVHPNMVHLIRRSEWRPVEPELRRVTAMHFGPLLNPAGLNWWSRVNDEAAARGASVMLIGSTGNFSISAGGPSHLVDLLTQYGAGPWWAQARKLGGLSLRSWRTVANVSLGPFVPRPLYRLALRASGRDPSEGFDVPLLRGSYRDEAERVLRRFFADDRPPRSYYDFRHKMLLKRDNAEKMSEAGWGLDVRDPTADRRLIELCLSFPPRALVSATSARPAYEAAFRDRIPAEVLLSAKRGRQGADWFELFPKDEVGALFRRYGQNRIVRKLFDLGYIERAIARWPEAGARDDAAQIRYQNEILGALAVAEFIDLNFPD